MKRIVSAAVLAFVLCSGFLCTGSQIHKAKLANADISSALNRTTKTIIQLTQQGSMSAEEEKAILPHINDATILSDQLQGCTNLAKTSSISACASPLFHAIQSDITASGFGLKNPTAQATFSSVLGGVTVALDELSQAAGGVK